MPQIFLPFALFNRKPYSGKEMRALLVHTNAGFRQNIWIILK